MKLNKILDGGKKFWEDHGHRIKPTAQFAGKVIEELANFAQLEKTPTLANYLDSAYRSKGHYNDAFVDNGDDYFVSKEWEPIFCYEIWPVIIQLMEDCFPDKIIPIKKANTKSVSNYVCNFGNGVKLGWKKVVKINGIYVSTGHADEVKQILTDNVWKALDSKCITIETFTQDWYTYFIINKQADHEKYVDCHTGIKYSEHIMKYRDKSLGRSLLFYGPPGTGKSNIVKVIANKLQLNTVRLHNVDRVRNRAIVEILDIFNPKAIIMEDIDHIYGHDISSLLEKLENFNAMGKYVLATANDLTKINDALLRPGRFDELIEILALDESSLREITQDEDIIKVVKNFPVAFIMEVMKRVSIFGKEEALKNLDDIHKRLNVATVTTPEKKAEVVVKITEAKKKIKKPKKNKKVPTNIAVEQIVAEKP